MEYDYFYQNDPYDRGVYSFSDQCGHKLAGEQVTRSNLRQFIQELERKMQDAKHLWNELGYE